MGTSCECAGQSEGNSAEYVGVCMCIYVLYIGVVAQGDIFILALEFSEGSRVNTD